MSVIKKCIDESILTYDLLRVISCKKKKKKLGPIKKSIPDLIRLGLGQRETPHKKGEKKCVVIEEEHGGGGQFIHS